MPSSKPRKHHLQARSRATVEAILEAAARVLVEEGFEAASTNRIAQVAGVSIGSLYQYFPNKAALVTALNERHTSELMSTLGAQFKAVWAAPMDAAVEELVRTMIAVHRVNPALHKVLVEQTPNLGIQHDTRAVERQAASQVLEFLRARSEALRPQNLELAAFLIVQTVEALTHTAVLEHPEYLDQEAFVDEIAAMVVGYLRP